MFVCLPAKLHRHHHQRHVLPIQQHHQLLPQHHVEHRRNPIEALLHRPIRLPARSMDHTGGILQHVTHRWPPLAPAPVLRARVARSCRGRCRTASSHARAGPSPSCTAQMPRSLVRRQAQPAQSPPSCACAPRPFPWSASLFASFDNDFRCFLEITEHKPIEFSRFQCIFSPPFS
jgi:hypothetical protein